MGKKLKPDIKSKRDKVHIFAPLPELSGPIIHICANSEASVDGCRGVVDCYDDRIKLKMPNGSVTFFGTGLTIEAYFDQGVKIKGEILNVEFSIDRRSQGEENQNG